MKPVRASWWIWAAVVLLLVGGLVLDAKRAQGQDRVQIKCVDGMCLVPQDVMLDLVKDAQTAVEYAKLCSWGGR